MSAEACCVITSKIPIDLMIKQRLKIQQDVNEGLLRTASSKVRRQETLMPWQSRWTAASTERGTHQYLPSVTAKQKMTVDWCHYTTQCLSGHENFRAKLQKFTLKADPWCPDCGHGVEDTAWHTLAECPIYRLERQEITAILSGDEIADKLAWSRKKILRRL